MSKYSDEGRYNVGVQFPTTKPGLNPSQVAQTQKALAESPTRQVDYPALSADQNDFRLAAGDFHTFTSAGNTITGFSGARPGLQAIVNVDAATNLTLAHNNASSTITNKILCHTGADIVLGPGESCLIRYDFNVARWRTIGF